MSIKFYIGLSFRGEEVFYPGYERVEPHYLEVSQLPNKEGIEISYKAKLPDIIGSVKADKVMIFIEDCLISEKPWGVNLGDWQAFRTGDTVSIEGSLELM